MLPSAKGLPVVVLLTVCLNRALQAQPIDQTGYRSDRLRGCNSIIRLI